jgi:hypothetical protein
VFAFQMLCKTRKSCGQRRETRTRSLGSDHGQFRRAMLTADPPPSFDFFLIYSSGIASFPEPVQLGQNPSPQMHDVQSTALHTPH